MKRIYFALVCLLYAAQAISQTPATVTVTTPTACITSIDGVPTANGTLTVFAPGKNGAAAPFTSTTGLVLSGIAQRSISGGELQGAPLILPNPAVTSPVNVGYTFTIQDNSARTSTTYASVFITPDGSGNWNICSLQAGNYQTAYPTVFTGGSFTGGNVPNATTFQSTVTLAADPTLNLQAATKHYVDNHAGGIPYPSGSGIPVVSSGAGWGTTLAAPAGAIVGTTDTQALTNKTVDGVTPTTFSYLDPTSSVQTQLNAMTPKATTVNGHALSANVVVSASDLTTGTLPHPQLPALVSGDIPNNAANTSGTAANLSGTPALPNGTTATTQTAGDASAKAATDAFVATAISGVTPPPQNRAAGSLTLGQAPDSMLGDRHVFNLRLASGEFDCASGCSTSPAAAANCPNDTCTGTQYAARLLINGPYTSFIARAKLRANVTGDISAFAGVTATPAYYGAYISGSNFVWNYSGGGPVTGPALTTGNYYRVWTMVNNGFASVGYCPSPSPSMAGCYDNVIDTTAAPPIVTVQEQTSGTGTVSSAKFAADNISGSSPLTPNMIPVTAPGEAGNAPLPILTYVPSNPAGSNVKFMVILPSNYNPAATNPWVMWFKGDGGSVFDIFDIAVDTQMADGLLQAGYAIVASDYTSNSCWGNAACVSDMQTAMAQARLEFNLDPVPYGYAGSMGGMVMLNAITHGVIRIRAAEMAFPAYSMSNIYASGTGAFNSQLQTAYSCSSVSTCNAAFVGYDPSAPVSSATATLINQTPVDVRCSAADTTINCAANGQALVIAINAGGGTATFTACTGAHGDPSCVLPAAAVDWFNKH